MLRTLRRQPLLVGMAEVLTDAVHYVGIVMMRSWCSDPSRGWPFDEGGPTEPDPKSSPHP